MSIHTLRTKKDSEVVVFKIVGLREFLRFGLRSGLNFAFTTLLLIGGCVQGRGPTAAIVDTGSASLNSLTTTTTLPIEDDESAVFFDPDTVLEIRLTLAPSELATLDANPFAREYVTGTFEAFGQTFDNVGIRYKGNSSLASADGKPSFKVSLDEYVQDQRLFGLKTLNFNNEVKDPSMQREFHAYELFREFDLAASRANYARVFVNDEYYGLYLNVEQVNRKWLGRWFDDKDGDLYKQYSPASLEYRGPDSSAYDDGTYIKKTNEDVGDWSDLIALCDLLENADDTTLAAELPLQFDTTVFLRWLAVNTYLSHIDGYTGFANNYYLYSDPVSGKLVYIPWDLDITFGTAGHAGTTTDFLLNWDLYDPQIPSPDGARPLLTRMMAIPEFRDQYTDLLAELIDTDPDAWLFGRIDTTRSLILDAALEDTRKPVSNDAFVASLTEDVALADGTPIIGIRTFVALRTPIVAAQLP